VIGALVSKRMKLLALFSPIDSTPDSDIYDGF